MIVNLREAAAFAQAAGVRLGLENEAGFTPSVAEHVRILEEVGSPALGLLLDTGNYPAGWPSVVKAAPRAVHVHAKFWKVATGRGRAVDGLSGAARAAAPSALPAAGSPSSTRRPSRRRRDFRAPSPTCAG